MRPHKNREQGCWLKNKLVLTAVFLYIHVFLGAAALNQECVSIEYFNAFESPASWSGYKSDVYTASGATFVNVSGDVPVDMTQGTGSLVFETTKPSGSTWRAVFRIGFGKDVNYTRMGNSPYLHLRIKWQAIAAGADMEIGLNTRMNDFCNSIPDQEARVRLSNYVTPSTSWQDVYIPISAFLAVNSNINIERVTVLRFYGYGTYTAVNKLFIDKMRVVTSPGCVYADAIKVNQVGYLPDMRKLAIVGFEPGAAAATPLSFNVVTEPGGAIVYTAALSARQIAPSGYDLDGDEVYYADFTSFTTPGTYRVTVPSISQVSQPFTIGCNVYNGVFRNALRFFYYARSGEAIVEPYAEGHTRQGYFTAETAAAYDYKAGTRDIRGGLFDAGDEHKDMHAQRETMWWLLETLKDFKGKVGPNSLNIPESSATESDLYRLIKYQLDWMIKMWNPDGSVHFWIDYPFAGPFCGTSGQISPPSSGSAGILAAIFAKAYVLFKDEPALAAYANSLLSMAQTSWAWLLANPLNVTPLDPGGGQYPYSFTDHEDNAARMWAAVNLYNATGTASYNTYFTSRYGSPLDTYGDAADGSNKSWGGVIQVMDHSMINMAYMDYINSPRAGASLTIQNELKNEFRILADRVISKINDTTYNIPIVASNHLYWGSSGMITTQAYVFKKVHDWTGNQVYKDAITDCVDWIMGRNPVNRIFISGYGDALHGTDIYGFYWLDIGNQPPGYLSGNINASSSIQDYIPLEWKRYLNYQEAAALEPGIYWNAELSWLMGYVSNWCAVTPTNTPTISPVYSPTASPTRTATATVTATAGMPACGISYVNSTIDGTTSSVTTRTTSVTVGNGTDRALLVSFSLGGTSGGIVSITYNGDAMIPLTDSGDYTFLYGLINPDSGTHDLIITWTTARKINLGVTEYNGVSAFGAVDNYSGAADPSVIFMTTTQADSWIVGCWARLYAAALTAPTGTERYSRIQTAHCIQGQDRPAAGIGAYSLQYTQDGLANARIVAAELIAAACAMTPTNTQTYTHTATGTATATPSATASPTASSTVTVTYMYTATGTQTNTGSPTFTPTQTDTVMPGSTETNTATRTYTGTMTHTFTATGTPTQTHTPTYTFTQTYTATATHTPSASATATAEMSATNTPTSTNSPTAAASSTDTATPSYTATFSPTESETAQDSPTNTSTASNTATASETGTVTETPAVSFTFTATGTQTGTYTNTQTFTDTATASATHTFTQTYTSTQTQTTAPSSTGTHTPLNTATDTGTMTATRTFTATAVNTATFTPTSTFTPVFTGTATFSATATGTFTIMNSPTPSFTIPPSTATESYTATTVPFIPTSTPTPAATESDVFEIPPTTPVIPFPNPLYDGQDLNIQFPVTQNAELVIFRLYTVSSRLVREVRMPGSYNAGLNTATVQKKYLKGIGRGTYYYVLTARNAKGKEARSRIGEVIILR